MAEKLQYLISVDDKGSLVFEQFKKNVTQGTKEIAAEANRASDAIKKHQQEVSKLTQLTREQRAEGRQQAFLFRETTGVLGDLTSKQSTLGKVLGESFGKMQQVDFALAALGTAGSGATGTMGSLAATLGSVALPLGIVAAAGFGVYTAFTADIKETQELTKKLTDLQQKLEPKTFDGAIAKIAEIEAATKKFKEESEKAGPSVWAWVKYFVTKDPAVLTRELANNTKEVAINEAEAALKRQEQVRAAAEQGQVELKLLTTKKEIADYQMKQTDGTKQVWTHYQESYNLEVKQLETLKYQLSELERLKADEQTILDLKLKILKAETEVTNEKKFQKFMTEDIQKLTPKGLPLSMQANIGADLLKRTTAPLTGVKTHGGVGEKSEDMIMKDVDKYFQDMAKVAPRLGSYLSKIQEDTAMTAEHGSSFVANLMDAEMGIVALEGGMGAMFGTINEGFNKIWNDTFGEANSLFEQFLQGMTQALLTWVEEQVATQIVTGLLGAISGGGGGLFGFLGGLFHQGGTVPKAHEGAYINAPASKEFLVKVRGGETVRTEQQEAALKAKGGVTINFNGPVSNEVWIKRTVESAMRMAGYNDSQKFFKNNRYNIAIGSAV
jgi:hypothetical protein